MASDVEICNMALSQIGAGSINSLTEPSIEAQQCKLYFTTLRNQMLTGANWGFATDIKILALTENTLFDWVYVYQYPSDCLKIQEAIADYATVDNNTVGLQARFRLYDEQHQPEIEEPKYQVYNIDGDKVIASNYENLRIKYTKQVTDPNLMTDDFRLALSNLIASRIAVAITGVSEGRALKNDALKEYQFYLGKAKEIDANQQHAYLPESEFTNIRY